MFVLDCLLVLLGVYVLPALAFWPQLLFSSKSAFAIPIVSSLIVFGLTTVLIALACFNTPTVIAISSGLAVIASLRCYKLWQHNNLYWPKSDIKYYLLHAVILLPYMIKLGTNGFDRGDEIYSWNYWAIQHYLQLPIDFSHTGAPYPQLFPKILAYCYKLLGDLELQLPIKACLVMFPYAMLMAIAMATKAKAYARLFYWLSFVLVVFGIGLEQFFNDGYADPVMSSCLICSLAVFWHFCKYRSLDVNSDKLLPLLSNQALILLAVICAVAAAISKQPALLWAMLVLPIMIIFLARKFSNRYIFFSLAVLCFACGLMWILGEGRNFHQNQGVLWLSIGNRDWISQILFSVKKYLVYKPLLLSLLLASFFASLSSRVLTTLWVIFVIPSLICWLLFGAYQLRLGQHIIAMAFFLYVAADFRLPFIRFVYAKCRRGIFLAYKHRFITSSLSVVAFLGFTTIVYCNAVLIDKPKISFLNAGRVNLQRYFGADAEFVYNNIYSVPTNLLWTPSRYIYGLFYNKTRLTSPDYTFYNEYNEQNLIDELRRKQPDYVFTVSEDIIDGPASKLLTNVIKQCPRSFEQVTHLDNRFDFVAYHLNKHEILTDQCLQTFVKQVNQQQNIAFVP